MLSHWLTIFVSCLLVTVASAQGPCLPCFKDRCNSPDGLNCPGGIVYDNKVCPCCYKCARQENEECTPPEQQDNPNVAYFFCDIGLTCETVSIRQREPPVIPPRGLCKGTPERSCPFGEDFSKGCMDCTCSGGKVNCNVNEDQFSRCPDPKTLPPCPNGAERVVSPEACCPVCPIPCIGGFRCEDQPPIIVTEPPKKVKGIIGNPFSFYFEVSGADIAYRIEPPQRGASLTVDKVQRGDEEEGTLTIDRVTVTGNTAGNYTIEYWNTDPPYPIYDVTVVVSYVRRPPSKMCDFEEDMCGMKSKSKSGLSWSRRMGHTDSTGTGPSGGHGGSGWYIYIDSSPPAASANDIVSICYPKLTRRQLGNSTTLTFAYHMHGEDVGRLRVKQTIQRKNPVSKSVSYIFSTKGDRGNKWRTTQVALTPIGNGKSVTICFVARLGNGSRGDMAIDDIKFA